MSPERKQFTLPWWRVDCQKLPEELRVLLNSYQQHPEWFSPVDEATLQLRLEPWQYATQKEA